MELVAPGGAPLLIFQIGLRPGGRTMPSFHPIGAPSTNKWPQRYLPPHVNTLPPWLYSRPKGDNHHIMGRGIERRNIFKDNRDRGNFLGRLAVLLPETQTTCYAWVLMPDAVRELGIALTHLARILGMRPSAVSYAVEGEEVIATDNNYQPADYWIIEGCPTLYGRG